MSQILFYIIIGLLVADFIFERFLEFLNSTQWSDKLPEEVKDIYDEQEYQKQQAYEKANFRFSMISFIIQFCVDVFNGSFYRICTSK